MRICAISPGVVHAVPRTIAFADQFDEVYFVDIAGTADSNRLIAQGVQYYKACINGQSLKNNRDLTRLLRHINPDVIVCHYASGDHFFNAVAYGKCPVAVIAMGHDILYDEGDCEVSFFVKLLTRMALRRSSYIAAKSNVLAERIKSYGVKTAPVEVNYWGSDLERFSQGDKTDARLKLGLDQNDIIILSSRALEPRLNIHLIIEAFSTIANTFENATLLVLGRSNPEYKQKVEETITRLNLSARVSIKGDVSEDILLQYYQASDVVISVAQSEGFPNTALEVMACKVPIIIGNIPHIDELLENNSNAWICEKDPDAIAGSILQVLSDKEKRLRICEAAYVTAREYADIKKNGIRFSHQLKQFINSYKPQPVINNLVFKAMFYLYRIQRKLAKVYK